MRDDAWKRVGPAEHFDLAELDPTSPTAVTCPLSRWGTNEAHASSW
ncbi:hypothetical protein [Nonomuraea dietziae]|uniref:Uncharacterized protein n=1 Tax=Nonomuraea dietziae TaxID=65515 RepID=A0A7W5V5Q5_9ACTN|nr:hypothetical protein [Nonomuraea dietziae]MBB3726034.1 hypothetical protein [Nonomuraea dietziae]